MLFLTGMMLRISTVVNRVSQQQLFIFCKHYSSLFFLFLIDFFFLVFAW